MKKEKELSNGKLLIFLFVSFFKVALFIVGGGLAMLPMIEHIFVREKKMLKPEDVPDMVAIMQTMPGMIAVNAAIFVGHKLAGFKGAFVSIIGVIMPSVIIMTIIAAFFQNLDVKNVHILGMFSCVRACVVAIFLGTAFRLAKNVLKSGFDYLIAEGFCVLLICGFSQIALILISVPVGWSYVVYRRLVKAEKE